VRSNPLRLRTVICPRACTKSVFALEVSICRCHIVSRSAKTPMRHPPAVTPTLAQQVWRACPTRAPAGWPRKSAKLAEPPHETIRRWRTNGWRPLDREQHPLDAARAALDDAIPVLTSDPLTTAESFCAANKDDAPIDELSDAELIRRASRELASATVVVAQRLMLQPSIAVTRPREVSILLSSLAKCAQAVSAGFGQAVTMQAGGRPRAR
jgi:hypothetical protein